ncbi:mobile element protein [Acinetobacter ursingii]|nr:mobile element protein [Acinetobacter ursingii]
MPLCIGKWDVYHRLDNGSRMNREVHVRFCEGLRVKFPWSTHPYIRTKQGWLYLCVMLDLFSRRIVGWQISHRIDRQLVCDAFHYAMARQGYPMGVMVHSDQGSQYCSRDFRTLLLTNNCVQSMSRRGNCWDNAVTESFFHTLKGHVVHGSVFATRKEANTVLFDYIEIYYNRVRRHSANG